MQQTFKGMRIDRFLLFVLLLASSYGCSEEQPYEVEKESVSIWEGDTRHVIIETDLTEHNYKLESENQEIATATLDEMGVCIATYKSGSTMIRLIDTDNKKIACEIYVYVKYFNSLKFSRFVATVLCMITSLKISLLSPQAF